MRVVTIQQRHVFNRCRSLRRLGCDRLIYHSLSANGGTTVSLWNIIHTLYFNSNIYFNSRSNTCFTYVCWRAGSFMNLSSSSKYSILS